MQLTDVFWDWNGTLLDDTEAALNTLNQMLARRGHGPVSMDFYRDHFGFPVRPFYARLGIDLDHEDWDALAQEYHDLYMAEPKHLNVDAVAALQLLRSRGVRQSVVSALRQDLLFDDLAQFGVSEYFTLAYGTDNLDGASKLDRAHDLMRDLGSPDPHGVVLIGDALHDRAVADDLGIGCVLHSTGSHAAWRLREVATTAVSLLDAVDIALNSLYR